MADGFDRSRFVLGMMDSNLLYRERLVGDDVFTTDVFGTSVCLRLFQWCFCSTRQGRAQKDDNNMEEKNDDFIHHICSDICLKLLKAHISAKITFKAVLCAHPKTSKDARSKARRTLLDQHVAQLK